MSESSTSQAVIVTFHDYSVTLLDVNKHILINISILNGTGSKKLIRIKFCEFGMKLILHNFLVTIATGIYAVHVKCIQTVYNGSNLTTLCSYKT